jgi:hypothetical protein
VTLPRSASRLAIAALLACVVACGKTDKDEAPVLPPLEGMEPAVAAKIRHTHEAVLADPSAATWVRHAKTLHAHDLWREAVPAYLAASERVSPPEKFELL